MTDPRPALLVDGDPRHGVVRFARQLAATANTLDGGGGAVRTVPSSGRVHLHFTDRLWGADPATAAARIERLAADRTVTVTLHDVPQPSDGPDRLPARTSCYRRVADAVADIVCNSGHEVALLHEMGVIAPGRTPTVIALPIIDPGHVARPYRPREELALLGFVYPGKGHGEALGAMAQLAPADRVPVVALGAAAPGHAIELDQLAVTARRLRVAFSATGWLEESQLLARARAAAVPLAAHRHISASGSIGSWIAAGRRPLVVDSRYARELELLRPATITRYAAPDLAAAIARALSGETSTWLEPGTSTRPHLCDTARAYLHWWAR